MIGRLHRQIVGLQTKESQCVGKIHTMTGKIGRLEAQLLRMSRKVDEKEDLVIQARSQAYIKCRYENISILSTIEKRVNRRRVIIFLSNTILY